MHAGLVIDTRKASWLQVSAPDNKRVFFFLPLSTNLISENSFGRIIYHLRMFSPHLRIGTNRAKLTGKIFAGELFFIFNATVTRSEKVQSFFLQRMSLSITHAILTITGIYWLASGKILGIWG